MFKIMTLWDTVDTPPQNMQSDQSVKALVQTIRKRYLNRVIPNGGLVVAFHDFIEAETAVVRAKTGALSYRVKFRLQVFNPDLGSILTGWVDSVTEEEGIKVSLGFFADVYVPRDKCPPGSVIKKNQNDELAVKCVDNMLVKDDKCAAGWWIQRKDLIHLRVRLVDFRPKNGLAMVVVGEVNSASLGPLKWWLTPQEMDMEVAQLEDSSEYLDDDQDEDDQLADDQELE